MVLWVCLIQVCRDDNEKNAICEECYQLNKGQSKKVIRVTETSATLNYR